MSEKGATSAEATDRFIAGAVGEYGSAGADRFYPLECLSPSTSSWWYTGELDDSLLEQFVCCCDRGERGRKEEEIWTRLICLQSQHQCQYFISASISASFSLVPSFLLSFPPLRAEDMHKCTGVHASVLATESSVEYATWNKIVPQKEVVEVVRKTWERKEKKEYNAARDMMYRRKKFGVVEVQEDKGGDVTEASSSSSDALVDDNDSHSTSSAVGEAGANVCASTSISSPPPTLSPLLPPVVPHINNDVSGGINMDSLEEIDRKWGPMAASLDPLRDVILFPSDHAEHAETFPWASRSKNHKHAIFSAGDDSKGGVIDGSGDGLSNSDSQDRALPCASSSSSSGRGTFVSDATDNLGVVGADESALDGDVDLSADKGRESKKWRLVVLESSWQHGKTMLRQVQQRAE